jgi:arylsulfatase A-like enzyme
MNVLWIMADQLRWDYLSCYGHPHLHTPNIDKLAARGVKFDRAYVQSPVCGPSRMSAYTGRYTRSHGCTWNGFPLRVGEPTLADHLRDIGVRSVLVGKTHMVPDLEGMQRLGIDPDSEVGQRVAQCGFEAFDRDDGLHPPGQYDPNPRYNDWLKSQGITDENGWEDRANAAIGADGERVSGWLLETNHLPADIPEEMSETPYMTRRAMEFMEGAGNQPWMCHLSFIKPHWPYIVPAPYHDMYGPEHIIPAVRSEAEKDDPQPVFGAYMESRICRSFSRDKVRDRVIPAYMGLIKQIDDQLGLLFDWMEDRGMMEDTMIVMSSDHGDYLGDHWMGEKDLFHDQSVRVPLIISDPRPEANVTRGTSSDALVEMIDLAPTFLKSFGGPELPHILEGRDLTPLLWGEPTPWRQYAISEYDYGTREARLILGNPEQDARLVMCCDQRWKYMQAEGYRPMLFDLETDPQELTDLGASDLSEHVEVRARMEAAISNWARQHHTRTTKTKDWIEAVAGKEPPGVLIGFWDESEFEEVFGKPFAERP